MKYRILLILLVVCLVTPIINAQTIEVDNWTLFNNGLKCASGEILVGTKIDSTAENFLVEKGYNNINKSLKELGMDYDVVVEPRKREPVISYRGVTLYKITEAKTRKLIDESIHSWAKEDRSHAISLFVNSSGIIYKIFFVKLFDSYNDAANFENVLNKQLFDLQKEYPSIRTMRDGSKFVIRIGFDREEYFYFYLLTNRFFF